MDYRAYRPMRVAACAVLARKAVYERQVVLERDLPAVPGLRLAQHADRTRVDAVPAVPLLEGHRVGEQREPVPHEPDRMEPGQNRPYLAAIVGLGAVGQVLARQEYADHVRVRRVGDEVDAAPLQAQQQAHCGRSVVLDRRRRKAGAAEVLAVGVHEPPVSLGKPVFPLRGPIVEPPDHAGGV